MTFVAPLFHLKTEAVWDYIRRHKLPINPVYRALHLSGDCLCGAFSRRSEAGLIATFYPEIANQIRLLEAKCPKAKYNTWSNGPSMQAAVKTSRERFVCADCQADGSAV